MKFNTTLIASALCAGLVSYHSDATIVTLDTSVGPIEINLYDETTPNTVANFLAYVNDGRYNNTFIHRSVPGFVVQGGGFVHSTGTAFDHVEVFNSVNNEAKLSNVRGTISMAKIGGLPNSATSEFFVNLIDNNASSSTGDLDSVESGYSVFGQLTTDSMTLIDQVAGYSDFNLNGLITTTTSALADVPLKDYSQADHAAGTVPGVDNFIMIYSATVSDAAVDTAAGLNPAENPNFGATPTPTPTPPVISSGGGNFGIAGLLMLGLAGVWRRKSK